MLLEWLFDWDNWFKWDNADKLFEEDTLFSFFSFEFSFNKSSEFVNGRVLFFNKFWDFVFINVFDFLILSFIYKLFFWGRYSFLKLIFYINYIGFVML